MTTLTFLTLKVPPPPRRDLCDNPCLQPCPLLLGFPCGPCRKTLSPWPYLSARLFVTCHFPLLLLLTSPAAPHCSSPGSMQEPGNVLCGGGGGGVPHLWSIKSEKWLKAVSSTLGRSNTLNQRTFSELGDWLKSTQEDVSDVSISDFTIFSRQRTSKRVTFFLICALVFHCKIPEIICSNP